MADREKVKMYINIAGEKIRLTVDYDEQDAVREAESQVVRLYDEWRQMFPKKSVSELLAMIAYQFAMYYMALRHRQDDVVASLKDFEKNIDMTLDFDIELAKRSTDENPVFYVQYAHARVCSILRNAISQKLNPETGEYSPAPLGEPELKDAIKNFNKDAFLKTVDCAKSLILKLEEFKSVIVLSAQNRTVYTICRYVQELAQEFHSFYNANRVICEDVELMKSRLALMVAVKTTLKNALDILAVSAPERM